jgi:hypothetical protein
VILRHSVHIYIEIQVEGMLITVLDSKKFRYFWRVLRTQSLMNEYTNSEIYATHITVIMRGILSFV